MSLSNQPFTRPVKKGYGSNMDTQQNVPSPKVRYIAIIGLAVLGIGVVFYHFVEGWTWVNSLYFCVVTLSTVGYGDIYPRTSAGRLFTTFYILIGIGIFAAVINFLIRRGAINRITKFRKNHPHK